MGSSAAAFFLASQFPILSTENNSTITFSLLPHAMPFQVQLQHMQQLQQKIEGLSSPSPLDQCPVGKLHYYLFFCGGTDRQIVERGKKTHCTEGPSSSLPLSSSLLSPQRLVTSLPLSALFFLALTYFRRNNFFAAVKYWRLLKMKKVT